MYLYDKGISVFLVFFIKIKVVPLWQSVHTIKILEQVRSSPGLGESNELVYFRWYPKSGRTLVQDILLSSIYNCMTIPVQVVFIYVPVCMLYVWGSRVRHSMGWKTLEKASSTVSSSSLLSQL